MHIVKVLPDIQGLAKMQTRANHEIISAADDVRGHLKSLAIETLKPIVRHFLEQVGNCCRR